MSAYLSAVLADAPLHYWRCNDAGGNILHDIGSSPILMYPSGGVQPLGYSGPVSDGGSVLCSGSAFFQSAAAVTVTYPVGVELWLMAAPGWGTWAFRGPGAGLGLDGSGDPIAATPGSGITVTGHVVAKEQWHHLVFNAATSGRSILLDGVTIYADATAPGGESITYRVGSDGSNPFQGFISEVAYYQGGLSSARAAAHFAAADQPSLQPFFQLNSAKNITVTPAVIQPTSAMIAQILAAVFRVYPTT